MPGPVLHPGALGACMHGGQLTLQATQTRVRVSGQPVHTLDDPALVAGCPFTFPAPTYHPCVRVRWTGAATRVRVQGRPVVLQDTVGVCLAADQAPQGTPMIIQCQPRVRAR